MEYTRAWAEINLDCLAHNCSVIRKRMPSGTALMAVVKADGYGHGARAVASTMLAAGASSLGVAICEEGLELRQAGITAPILIMGFTPPPLLESAIMHNLTQTVFSPSGAKNLSQAAARVGKRAAIHIKIDTGMSRLGFLPGADSVNAICKIANDPNIFIEGIYTHCATSDQLDHGFMYEQEERFNWMIQELSARGLGNIKRHIANSGAVSQMVRCAVGDSFAMDFVRVGIMLYGLPPSSEMADSCAPLGLRPAMKLYAQVSSVKRIPAGVGISYSHIYKTTRESTIAVLPIGYADGYPRRLSHGGRVRVRGQFAPIAGAICMDQCMIDVTDIPGVSPGDTVTLMGSKEEGLCADDLADLVGTISYEVVCGIGKRVPRVYVKAK